MINCHEKIRGDKTSLILSFTVKKKPEFKQEMFSFSVASVSVSEGKKQVEMHFVTWNRMCLTQKNFIHVIGCMKTPHMVVF